MRPHPFPARPAVRRAAGALGLLLALLAPACGREGPGPAPRGPAAGAPPPAARPVPEVDPLERARFALARLTTGPLPRAGLFTIPDLHGTNLQLAIRDLVALPEETLGLLRSEELWRRHAGPEARDLNPLHSLLDVLAEIDPKPTDLVLRWAMPGLASPYLQLRRRAVRALATTRDAAAAPALVGALERDADDPEVSRVAVAGLLGLGSPWRERVVETVYRVGSPVAWESLSERLHAAGGEPTDDLLAWWALLAETSGPRQIVPGASRVRTVPSEGARFLLDPVVRLGPPDRDAPTGVRVEGPLPAAALDAPGTVPTRPSASPVLALEHATVTGKDPAASARCALAGRGHAPHEHSVRRDLGAYDPERGTGDATVYYVALRCGAARAEAPPREDVLGEARALLAAARGVEAVDAARLERTLGDLAALGAEGADLLVAFLRELRPAAAFRRSLEQAYDALASADHDRAVAEVGALLLGADPEAAGVARHLVQRSRDPAFLPALRRALAEAPPDLVATTRRLLWWLHTAPDAADPAAAAAFAAEYAAWVDEAPDDAASALVTGLLDLGEAGEEAFAARLRGPRRRVFLLGLLQARRIVGPAVAEALLGGVDARTPAEDRQAAWVAAYRTAPPEAAAALAAARERVDPSVRAEADDVLEVVRHRAPRGPPRR